MTPRLKIPDALTPHVDTLTQSLEKSCGANLVSLCVYGSAARGGYVAGVSDIDLVVVLHDTAPEKLAALTDALLLARHAAGVETMILRLNDVAPAADVFPLFYDDIRSCHVILSGTDVFKDVVIGDAHRRLRIEQELREAKIRMHRAVVDSAGEPGALAGFVYRKVKQIRGPLKALLGLLGTPCGDTVEDVLGAFGKKAGVETAPLLDVHKDPGAAHACFRMVIDAAIQEADRLEVK